MQFNDIIVGLTFMLHEVSFLTEGALNGVTNKYDIPLVLIYFKKVSVSMNFVTFYSSSNFLQTL